MREPGLVALRVASLVLAVSLAWLTGCGDSEYSQKTPEEVIRTARRMVERGEARKLSSLLYAENDDMKKVLSNVGVLMGNLQRLGTAVTENFPAEVQQLKERAQEAGKTGKATSLLGQIAAQASGSQPRPSRRAARDMEKWRKEQNQREKQFGDALNMLFADPYGFLEASAGRVTTTPLTDDTAAILWDGKPVLPPLGMVMRRSAADGRWYVVPPLNIPGFTNFLPQSPQEYKVFGALVAILNNVIVDLARDVREKRITTINDLSVKAGEKAFMPAAMGYVAYSKMIEDRRKKASATKAAKPPATPR